MSSIICTRHEREIVRTLGVDAQCPYCHSKTRKVVVFEVVEKYFVPWQPIRVLIREKIVENRVLTIFCPNRCKKIDSV